MLSVLMLFSFNWEKSLLFTSGFVHLILQELIKINMGKLNYCVDVSIDGYIARKNHAYDFLLPGGEHFNEFMNSFSDYEIVLMGRKTYEVGLKAGVVNPDLPVRQIVISSTLTSTVDRRIEIVS